MKTFSPETKQSIMQAQNNYCKMCLNPIHSYHHKLQNTVANRKKFPILINSVLNCTGLCFHCHTHKAHLFRIKPELASLYEKFLQELRDDVPF